MPKLHGNSKVVKFAKKSMEDSLTKSSKFSKAIADCTTKMMPNHDGKRPKMTGNGYRKPE